MVGGNAFGKTICSICYEDLKPIVEDLQAISLCGHVFHELCLQQWFEYCSSKKSSCPVCKQTCSDKNAGRLYFQSVGDPSDPILSQKPVDREEDPEVLRREVRKLEAKVSGVNSTLERQEKDLKELNEELCICKEQAKKEAAFKNEAMKQKALIQQLLHLRSEELDKSSLECSRLQERNMSLAKELAALKLVSDLNLEEEEVLKLASLGNEANNKDTIDILKKSLVIRNKSYKELMAKCNLLGRGETRSLKKLEKAKERINKLKTRVQELETAIEVKDNEVLRALKASKKSTRKGDILNGIHCISNFSSFNNSSSEYRMEQPAAPMFNLDQTGFRKSDNSRDLGVNNAKENTLAHDQERDSFLIDEDVLEIPKAVHKFANFGLKAQISVDVAVQKSSRLRPELASDNDKEAPVQGPSNVAGLSSLRTCTKHEMGNAPDAVVDADVTLLTDDIEQVQPLFQIRKESPSPVPLSQPGDRCFSGGLLGPDGTNRHLGKWCKRVQSKGSMASSVGMQEGSRTNTGDLIAVGADGRGGRIKVLRSLNQSLDGQETSILAKRCKYGAKTSSLPSRGCLQIEHFFGRASQ
ncbi:hypothetical protein L1049_013611 [Liquidambar formosana]|uniref:RING-type domain-containing protein n=1 Tax=Liquidambar formosana TaxID=63359 RepID=A0AAP0RKT6_LIQFO